MKNKPSGVVKNIISALTAIAKTKFGGVKSKADSMRSHFMVLTLLKSKKLSLGSISQKIHAFLDRKGHGYNKDDCGGGGDQSTAIVICDGSNDDKGYNRYGGGYYCYDDGAKDDKYPDLTHCLFDEEDGDDQGSGSVIDMVRNSKENGGEDFHLEDEIDHVADLFIKRFRKQIRLQKLESFKRHQEKTQRNA